MDLLFEALLADLGTIWSKYSILAIKNKNKIASPWLGVQWAPVMVLHFFSCVHRVWIQVLAAYPPVLQSCFLGLQISASALCTYKLRVGLYLCMPRFTCTFKYFCCNSFRCCQCSLEYSYATGLTLPYQKTQVLQLWKQSQNDPKIVAEKDGT